MVLGPHVRAPAREGERERERRRGEARDEILKEAALSNRESNLHTLHKRDTDWRGEGGDGGGLEGDIRRVEERVVLLENTVIGCLARDER